MGHEKFHYHTMDELQATAEAQGVRLTLSEDMSCLGRPLTAGKMHIANRLAVQPMEGCDAGTDGAPGPLTRRRYVRFAEGGAGLIWVEAVAYAPEVRASAHQLYLTEENAPEFARMLDEAREAGLKKNGFAPVFVMQATHSGRYAKPDDAPRPLIAYRNPILEEGLENLPFRILTDDELKRYEDAFADSARLAKIAGFDSVDVKCCHRYLASELLSAYTRPGPYGGSFENRTRFIRNAVLAAKAASDLPVACRMNAYDGFPYPWGFGTREGEGIEPDLTEGKALARMLVECGVELLNVTIGNPYKNPHVNRPYDRGNYVPDEHPLFGLARIMDCGAAIQEAVPDTPVVGSGFSYPRQFSANLAAGMVGSGSVAMAGFGRMALACPDFANRILHEGGIDPGRVCLTCGQCAVLLRHGQYAGCVVRDGDVYKPYKEA